MKCDCNAEVYDGGHFADGVQKICCKCGRGWKEPHSGHVPPPVAQLPKTQPEESSANG